MGIALLLFPALTSALFFVVFRKTGLSLAWSIAALLPLAAAAMPIALLSLAQSGHLDVSRPIFSFVPLAVAVLTLLPLALLALVRWPNVADKSTSLETFK
ncbi:MAG: hypothetical protein ACRC14_03325 [Paracoccaceae bacterium]